MQSKTRRRPLKVSLERLEPRALLSTLIALIDTGVDLGSTTDAPYYDLAAGYNAYTGQPAAPDGSNVADNSLGGGPGHGHGSNVADAIVAAIGAAASQPGAGGAAVKIVPIRDTDPSGQVNFNALIEGIYYAANHGAAVINLSVNYDRDYSAYLPDISDPAVPSHVIRLSDAIRYAESKGAVVVTAPGNSGVNIDDPSSTYTPYPPLSHVPGDATIVAASFDPATGQLWPGSNWGPSHVELAAPLSSPNAWQTSYAAGYTSGVAGVVAALRPDFTNTEVIDRLEATEQQVPALAGKLITGGVLSASSAVSGLATAAAGPLIDHSTNAGGTVTAHGEYTADGTPAVAAFDGNLGTKWIDLNAPSWIQYQFPGGQSYVIDQYTITSVNDFPSRDPRSWVLEGSNDGVHFTVLDTRTNQTFANRFQTNTYNFVNNAAYAYYRLDQITTNGDPFLSIDGIALLGPGSPTTTTAAAISSGSAVAAGSFQADTDFSGGRTASYNSAVDTSGLPDPVPQSVFQAERFGNFTYTIPNLTPGASYTVRLYFAELYWNSPGIRLFNVAINGQQVLTNFDIFAVSGGAKKAVEEPFTTQADGSGRITVAFSTIRDNAQLCGIEILAG
jgi:hypothetical protein